MHDSHKLKLFSFENPFSIKNHSQLPPWGSNENRSQYVVPFIQIFSEFKIPFMYYYMSNRSNFFNFQIAI